ncbi:MAG TPA: MerR family transcriptional regulator [Sandaracinaceae bacterium LLY-WYZ-13_1]|nr:MerR family transcriptional regulator [Sandaracinaceae bacterium LLY-WYZ-13_1]
MAEATHDEPDPHPYRMKDLCELTGLGRQAIHFYIQRGLLPPGLKTGRNMAWYGEEHLDRLKMIKKLQHERFLPLKAIKAILDDQQSAFDQTQRSFLLGVKQHLGQSLAAGTEAPGEPVAVDELLARLDLPRADFDRVVALELIGARVEDGREVIAQDDVWLLESWAEVKRLGFAEELGIGVDDLTIYDEIVTQLFQREAQLLAPRIPDLPPERAAEMIEKVLPLVHTFVTGLHRAKIRNFLASIG